MKLTAAVIVAVVVYIVLEVVEDLVLVALFFRYKERIRNAVRGFFFGRG
jgi:hypothetical protein